MREVIKLELLEIISEMPADRQAVYMARFNKIYPEVAK